MFSSVFDEVSEKKAKDRQEVGVTLELIRSLLMLLQSPGVTHAEVLFGKMEIHQCIITLTQKM